MDHEREHDVPLDGDVEAEFWSRVPDRRFSLGRLGGSPRRQSGRSADHHRSGPVGSRSHHDDTGPIAVPRPITESIPVVTDTIAAPVRRATQHVDPLIRRLGVAAIITALAVPVALGMRGDDPTDVVSPQVAAADGTTAAPQAATTPTAAGTANPWSSIDVDALPEAVPVNPDPTAAPATEVASSPAEVIEPASSAATTATAPVAARTEAVGPACGAEYAVQSGDAWLLIADRANVSLRTLLDVNGASTSTALYPGRTICLPVGATMPAKRVGTSTTSAPATTAPKPTTTTAAPAPAPTASYSRAQVERIIREVWPDHLEDRALAIAIRESNLQPTARNFCCHGLFQIYFSVHRSWLANIGVTSSTQLYDPRVNAYAAYVLYLRSGSFAPWGG